MEMSASTWDVHTQSKLARARRLEAQQNRERKRQLRELERLERQKVLLDRSLRKLHKVLGPRDR